MAGPYHEYHEGWARLGITASEGREKGAENEGKGTGKGKGSDLEVAMQLIYQVQEQITTMQRSISIMNDWCRNQFEVQHAQQQQLQQQQAQLQKAEKQFYDFFESAANMKDTQTAVSDLHLEVWRGEQHIKTLAWKVKELEASEKKVKELEEKVKELEAKVKKITKNSSSCEWHEKGQAKMLDDIARRTLFDDLYQRSDDAQASVSKYVSK